ncbi:MAG: type II secretion system F family protein [Candidatus Aenigmatarchaeota archaeon]
MKKLQRPSKKSIRFREKLSSLVLKKKTGNMGIKEKLSFLIPKKNAGKIRFREKLAFLVRKKHSDSTVIKNKPDFLIPKKQMGNMRIKEKLAFFTPTKYKNYMRRQMVYAGLKSDITEKFIGFAFFFSLFLGFVIGFDLWLIGMGLLGIAAGVGAGVIIIVLIQVVIILIADSRAAEIENVLPDALQMMAANVRAGMTVDRAIWLSARPEFGAFEEELRIAGANTVAGKPIKTALMEMSGRVKSDLLEKTFRLVIEGINSGGELAHLLEETAANARSVQTLKKELKSSVTTYSIFIFFAAVLGAPALYAISLFFVQIMSKLWTPQMLGGTSAVGGGMGGGMLAKAGAPTITADQLFWFAIAAISITTFFGSLIIGLIQTGKEKNGIKFIPALMFGAIAVFFLAQMAIKMIFGAFFSF